MSGFDLPRSTNRSKDLRYCHAAAAPSCYRFVTTCSAGPCSNPPLRAAMTNRTAVVLALWSLASICAAQEDSTRGDFWPEVDAYYRLSSTMKLLGVASFQSGRTDAYSEGQYGIHWDVSWKPIFQPHVLFHSLTDRSRNEKLRPLTFRLGYRYINQTEDTTKREDRGIAELTLRWALKGGVLVADRNRLELRWIEGAYSTRYRNRLSVEREVEIGHYPLTPYVSAELYYDSRYDEWNRQRYRAGVELPLHHRAMLDAYYAHQHDAVSQPSYVNAFGLMLSLYF